MISSREDSRTSPSNFNKDKKQLLLLQQLFFIYLFIFTSVEIPLCSASISASISSFVLYSERLMRSEESALFSLSPNAISAELGVDECDEQADPLETKIPFAER